MDFNFDEFWKAVKSWPSTPSFLVILIFESGVFKYLWPSSQEDNFFYALVVIILVTYFVWKSYRKFPKKRKGSFGFLVSIYCDDSSIDKKFREDFIKTLKTDLKGRKSGEKIDFIELKKHISEKVNDKDEALNVLNKCNCDFLIYGRVRTREEGGEKIHFLDINCAAQHTPIPDIVSNRFAQEMGEVLPNKIRIEDSKFLESFEITSKLVETSSKYLIGHIKFLAHDFNAALEFYNEVLSKLTVPEKPDVTAKTLRSRCYESITVVYETKIFLANKNWVDTHSDIYLEEVNELIGEYDCYSLTSTNIDRVRAIFLVFEQKDFVAARVILDKTLSSRRDALWFLNSAFLHACDGNLKNAVINYRKAKERPSELFGNNLLGDVENFIVVFIERHPDFSRLHYCLGFINKELKEDSILARQHFSAFLECTSEAEFTKERELATRWIINI